MDHLLQDLKYAVRSLVRAPVFTLVAAFALAIGIGANTAIFSAVNALLLQPLPFGRPAELVYVGDGRGPGAEREEALSIPDIADLRKESHTLAAVGAWGGGGVTLSGDGDAEIIQTASVSAGLFPMLGIKPQLGRPLEPGDEGPKAAPVVLVSAELWKRRFSKDPALIGKVIVLDGKQTTVVGVMAPGLRFPLDDDKTQLWIPLGQGSIDHDLYEVRGAHFLNAIGRLAPGVSVQQAQAEATAISTRLAERFPNSNQGRTLRIAPLADELSKELRPALLLLLGAVGFVLLIACGNVANLLLARASARQRELAVRAALGASRARVVRQLLTESALLGLLGGALGLALAVWGLDLVRLLAPPTLQRLREVRLDGLALGFTGAVSLLTALVFGLVPALLVSRPDLQQMLQQSSGRGSAGGHHRLRGALVVVEVALSLLLLVGAGLLGRSFASVSHVDPGFRSEGVITAALVLPKERYGGKEKAKLKAAFLDQLVARLATAPGVKVASTVIPLPFSGSNISLSFTRSDRPPLPPGKTQDAAFFSVSPGYFNALQIPLKRGRLIAASDLGSEAKVAVISESLAARYFPGEDPLGKRVVVGGAGSSEREVIGIVGNVRAVSLERDTTPQLYVPSHDSPWDFVQVAIKADGNAANVIASLRREVKALDSGLALDDIKPLEELLGDRLAARRFNLTLLFAFAAAALVLAGVGLYGVMSYSVTQRTREIGIRMALGAERAQVLRLVLGQGLKLSALGIVLGGAASLLLARLIAGMVYGVSPSDPLTYAVIAVLVGAVALLATWLPARRATRVPPAIALGAE